MAIAEGLVLDLKDGRPGELGVKCFVKQLLLLVQCEVHPLGLFHQIPEKVYLATSDLSEGDVFLLLAQLHQGLHLPLLLIVMQRRHILARILLIQRELVHLD